MPKIGLSVYGFYVQKNLELLELHNVIDGASIIDIINEFVFKNRSEYDKNTIKEKVFKFACENEVLTEYNKEKEAIYDYTYGEINSGSYGEETKIIDTNTNKLSHTKTPEEANVLPFKFCLAVPRCETEHGIIMFQSIGVNTVKTIFCNKLEKYFKDNFGGYKITIGQITKYDYVNNILNKGILKSIKMIKFEIPKDRAEQLGINSGVETTYEEIIIRNPIGFIERKKENILRFIKGQSTLNSIIQLDDFEYNNLSFEFKVGNSSKTLNLQHIDSLKITEDITERISLLKGHPTKSSMIPIFKETAEEYLKEMGFIK